MRARADVKHAHPWSARMGLRAHELDVGWLTLRALAFVGVVSQRGTRGAILTRVKTRFSGRRRASDRR